MDYQRLHSSLHHAYHDPQLEYMAQQHEASMYYRQSLLAQSPAYGNMGMVHGQAQVPMSYGQVDHYYDVAPVQQPVSVPRAMVVLEMLQPSPIVPAPIPFLNSHYSEDYYQTPQDEVVVPESSYYPSIGSERADSRTASGLVQAWSEPMGSFTTFPTPSELLEEMTANGEGPLATNSSFEAAFRASFSASPECKTESVSQDGDGSTDTRPNSPGSTNSSSSVLPDAPTPSSISSHEKKRHYLECLEYYVLYLHNQFQLLGVTPMPLRRVNSYKGLNSRSIRTVLVHMEGINKKRKAKMVAEERRFLAMRSEVLRKEAIKLEREYSKSPAAV